MSQLNNNNGRRPTALAIPDTLDPTDPNFLVSVMFLLNFILWLYVAYRTLMFFYV